jgi:hypothetical protein
MYIGGGIILLVVGGILAFGVRDRLDAIDLEMVGWVCMGGGALAIILSLLLAQRSSRTEVVQRRNVGPDYVERRDVGPPDY